MNEFTFYFFDAFEMLHTSNEMILFGKFREQSIAVHVKKVFHSVYISQTEEDVMKKLEEERKRQNFRECRMRECVKKTVLGKEPKKFVEFQYVFRGTKFVFGKHQIDTEMSAVETFLLSKNIKGPCWLNVKGAAEVCATKKTTCALEMTVDELDCISLVTESPPPPLKIMVLQTYFDEFLDATKPRTKADAMKSTKFRAFSYLCESKKGTEIDLHSEFVFDKQKKLCICKEKDEKSLIEKLHDVIIEHDPDILLGHQMYEVQLPRLLAWAHLFGSTKNTCFFGRLRKQGAPFCVGNHAFDFENPSPNRLATEGRLIFDTKVLCDTYHSPAPFQIRSDELQEYLESYGVLSSETLKRDVLVQCFAAAEKNVCEKMLEETEEETFPPRVNVLQNWFATLSDDREKFCKKSEFVLEKISELSQKLDFLGLTLSLTKLCGNLWRRNLAFDNMNRVEWLFMHELQAQNFIVEEQRKSKKRAQKTADYMGGTILDAVKGWHDRYAALFDVQSMYPNIIAHHNLCFTASKTIMPNMMRMFVQKRQESETKNESTVIKLLSNQMYGCFGYQFFRFKNQALAAHITQCGREILRQMCECVEKKDKVQIVYGHTDSIMVLCKESDVDKEQFRQIVAEICSDINAAVEAKVKIDAFFRRVYILGKNQYVGFSGEKNFQLRGCDVTSKNHAYLAEYICAIALKKIMSEGLREDSQAWLKQYFADVFERLQNVSTSRKRWLSITNKFGMGISRYTKETQNLPHLNAFSKLCTSKKWVHGRRGASIEVVHDSNGAQTWLPLMLASDKVVLEEHFFEHLANLIRKTFQHVAQLDCAEFYDVKYGVAAKKEHVATKVAVPQQFVNAWLKKQEPMISVVNNYRVQIQSQLSCFPPNPYEVRLSTELMDVFDTWDLVTEKPLLCDACEQKDGKFPVYRVLVEKIGSTSEQDSMAKDEAVVQKNCAVCACTIAQLDEAVARTLQKSLDEACDLKVQKKYVDWLLKCTQPTDLIEKGASVHQIFDLFKTLQPMLDAVREKIVKKIDGDDEEKFVAQFEENGCIHFSASQQ